MTDPQQPAVPPPHPFAERTTQGPQGRGGPGGRGGAVSTAAMALGLAGLVTVIVSALYLPLGAVLGAVLGVAGAVLGVVGLVSRRRRGAAVTGLASGGLAVLAALVLGVISTTMLVGSLADPVRSGGAPGSGASSGGDEQTAEEVPWPENMATGGIVFDRDGVVRSDAPESGAPEPAESPAAGSETDAETHAVRVYVDYRCPYCSEFETANGDALQQLAESGRATVEIIPLAFLDRVSPDAYSSRASGAVACVVDAQPEAAWQVHRHLFDPAVQPSETTNGLDDDALIAAVDEAAGGANERVRSCISSQRFVPFAQALDDWVFDHPVPGAQDPQLRVTSTPFALVDGVPYTGAADDAEAFSAFLAEQGIAAGGAS
ncbi:thioredoxin domain-containing protein [Leucobacter chromiiresistens]|uniref:Protein-disulfide isomerase n=2 Tax=Leucobacter chromiiresistens TaxID=1079994 RepID=A0A1H0ZCT2_9MICO|nr:thioredoxin domain-containing protein [Leucobacter chromiiresistens]SDQ25230.1 Protein-disulfide isomerase [Leucobacter chromiiresistens]